MSAPRIGLVYDLLGRSPRSGGNPGDVAKGHPIWLNSHFNHPAEITADAEETCSWITRAHPCLRGREDVDAVVESKHDRLYGQRNPL